MTTTHDTAREIQQDARAWSDFTGTKYTASLRQMQAPMAQGFLGERASARKLIATLQPLPHLGRGGFDEGPFVFNRTSDFIEMALITDVLRMFTPIGPAEEPEVNSYSIKHTAERFLRTDTPYSYVPEGQVIWAALTMGLMTVPQKGCELLVGIHEREHNYAKRQTGGEDLQAHHYRPPGYTHLEESLRRCAAGDPVAIRLLLPDVSTRTYPFHEWLVSQAGRDDRIGDIASEYALGVRISEHGIARNAAELLPELSTYGYSPEFRESAEMAIKEWSQLTP